MTAPNRRNAMFIGRLRRGTDTAQYSNPYRPYPVCGHITCKRISIPSLQEKASHYKFVENDSKKFEPRRIPPQSLTARARGTELNERPWPVITMALNPLNKVEMNF